VGVMPSKSCKTPFTGDPEADRLLETNAFALVCGMLLDQQVPMEWAFKGPLEIVRRLGGLDAGAIAAMSPEAVIKTFVAKPALHRYPASMAKRVHELARFVVDHYGGRAEAIWDGVEDPADLLARLKELPGYGPQKAKIFLAILGKRLAVAPAGWEVLAEVYGQPGHRSIADVDGPGAIDAVRTYKQAMKAESKAAAASAGQQTAASSRSKVTGAKAGTGSGRSSKGGAQAARAPGRSSKAVGARAGTGSAASSTPARASKVGRRTAESEVARG